MDGLADERPSCGGNVPRRRWSAWLTVEVLVGSGVVLTLAIRNDLFDYVSAIPTAVVVAVVGIVACVLRRRSLFLLGAIGAVLGVLLHDPYFHVSFSPHADPGDTTVVYARMLASIRFQGALFGAAVGVGLDIGLGFLKRGFWKDGRFQFTLRWLFLLLTVAAVLLSCWRWLFLSE